MKKILILALALGGCAQQFENRVYCSADKRTMAFVSWYEGIGIGATIASKDSDVLCAIPVTVPATAASAPASAPVK